MESCWATTNSRSIRPFCPPPPHSYGVARVSAINVSLCSFGSDITLSSDDGALTCEELDSELRTEVSLCLGWEEIRAFTELHSFRISATVLDRRGEDGVMFQSGGPTDSHYCLAITSALNYLWRSCRWAIGLRIALQYLGAAEYSAVSVTVHFTRSTTTCAARARPSRLYRTQSLATIPALYLHRI